MSTPSDVLVKLSDISRSFGEGSGKVTVLHGVDAIIAPSESLTISGPSGSGKSTLLNILGLLDDGYEGDYWFAGENVRLMPRKQVDMLRGRKIGFVFQDFQLVPYLDVSCNVAFSLTYNPMQKAEKEELVAELVDAVGLWHRRHANIRTLSGGEKQRVAIARALAGSPQLLLADEPTGNLDQKNSAAILELLANTQEKRRFALVIVTHDPAIVQAFPRNINILDGYVQN
ncbi:MAG: ABC transporter ATP-binding protein [Actinomycetaceae bacterium]|nr:ABC transporter ATP-binding protein [Actinomycetaceae bacterium]